MSFDVCMVYVFLSLECLFDSSAHYSIGLFLFFSMIFRKYLSILGAHPLLYVFQIFPPTCNLYF